MVLPGSLSDREAELTRPIVHGAWLTGRVEQDRFGVEE